MLPKKLRCFRRQWCQRKGHAASTRATCTAHAAGRCDPEPPLGTTERARRMGPANITHLYFNPHRVSSTCCGPPARSPPRPAPAASPFLISGGATPRRPPEASFFLRPPPEPDPYLLRAACVGRPALHDPCPRRRAATAQEGGGVLLVPAARAAGRWDVLRVRHEGLWSWNILS